MSEDPDPPPALTRRGVLGSAAGLATVASVSGRSGAAQSATARPTVLTRNAYLGVDLFRLFRAGSEAEFRRIAGRLLAEVDPAVYAARADAIAGEVAATDADVVALQEVALLRTQRPGDFGSEGSEPAADVLVDVLALVESALEDRDLDYEAAAVATTTDVELPADTEDGRVDVRLADREVLLVRADLETADPVARTFETTLPVPLPGTDRALALERGYCAVGVRIDGVGFRAVSTHLESVSPETRREQARELLDALPADGPVILGGDFNSGPGTESETYDLLTAELRDAYAVLGPDADGEGEGFTCCQASSLRNDRSRLDERIDALLYRGRVRPTAVDRVGHRPEDRVEVRVDGETVRVWPSDHAGVVGTFEVEAPTPTPTPEPTLTPTSEPTQTRMPTATTEPAATATRRETATATPTPERTTTAPTAGETSFPATDGSGPGMGVVAALAGLSAAVAARLRRS